MNHPNILLISKDAETKRLLETAAPPFTTIQTTDTTTEGFRL